MCGYSENFNPLLAHTKTKYYAHYNPNGMTNGDINDCHASRVPVEECKLCKELGWITLKAPRQKNDTKQN